MARAEARPFITVATTTSADQSGLLGYLLPFFTQKTGIEVYVVAIGTGEALKSGELGECDMVLVHDKPRELEFVQAGFGSTRREIMYNDFVLIGPNNDPAEVDGMRDILAALRKMKAAKKRDTSGEAYREAARRLEKRHRKDAPEPGRSACWRGSTGRGRTEGRRGSSRRGSMRSPRT
jgi:tungstate transport system substrate-binding protein